MKGVGLTCLALMSFAVVAYGQDFKKANTIAAMMGASLTKIADENREAILHATLSQQLTSLPPSVRLKGDRPLAQERSVEPQQSEKKESAVSFEFGMDLVSRFVWRGIDLGDAPAFQPYASVSFAGFEFGAWGSYAFDAPAGTPPFSENDWYLQYSDTTSVGTFTAALTDYYFPSDGLRFFNYRGGNEGAHTLEVSMCYGGPEKFPLELAVSVNVYNDTSNSFYLEIGHSFEVGEVSVNAFVGGAVGESVWYEVGVKGFRLINAGLTFSRSLPLSSTFSLPVSVSVGINPYSERSFLVFKASL
jgi:hypothetical protein